MDDYPISDEMRDLIVRYMNAVNDSDNVQEEALLHAIKQQGQIDYDNETT